jgi:DNA-directed RNA polymerase
MTNDNVMQREHQLEKQAAEKGAAKVRKMVAKAKEKGLGADTPGGVALMKRAVAPLSQAIAATLEAAKSGKAGRRHVALATMELLPPDVLAYLTVRESIHAALDNASITTAALSIGSMVEEELRLQSFDDQQPDLYATMMRRLKERGAQAGHVRKVFVFTANQNDIELPTLTKTEKLHLGMKMIELLIEGTGFCEMVTVRDGKKTKNILRPTEVVAKWMEDRNLRAELLAPAYAPMVVPPKDWEGVTGGGYLSPSFKALSLVKGCTKAHAELLAQADLGPTLRALNAIQRTPWKINTRVLEVMTEVWERGLEIAMPNREDRALPNKPAGHRLAETSEEAWANVSPEAKKAYLKAARHVHEDNASSRGKRLGISVIIKTAQELAGEEAIYFPHQLDFRGRAYAVPVALNPQGNDHAKSLLTAAKGKPIMDAVAAGWLAIDGANRFGFDKASLDERIAWVEERQEQIRYTAENPFGDLWWADADEPWRFLAWCFDYAGFLNEGYGYVSDLPCSSDGTCNGLQHFSAMLRDPVGGAAVNLVPGDRPSDIYQRVADRVIEKLRADQDNWQSRGWIDFGIDRKVTKRPVMVLPYGGKFKSCMGYVRDAVDEKIAGGKENPFGDELSKASTALARLVWDSIGDVVVAARDAMDWLQKCASAATAKGQAISWTAPSGFPAYQCYMDRRERRVKTRLQGSLVYLSLSEETDKLDKAKQRNSVSPNFVHSMDAAAMMLTINLALDNGITSFAMIHDSYGTLAADMDKLGACIRHAFVDMYEEHDVLAEFVLAQPEEVRAQCPQLPARGDLDIRQVLDSTFFFA